MEVRGGRVVTRWTRRRPYVAPLGAVRDAVPALQRLVRPRPRPLAARRQRARHRQPLAHGRRPVRRPDARRGSRPITTSTTSAHCTNSPSGTRTRPPSRSWPAATHSTAASPAGRSLPSRGGTSRTRATCSTTTCSPALPCAGFDVDAYAVEPCPANHGLVDGDVVDLGDVTFEVLHLPGHSPDSIGLYDRAAGVLFSGDAVYDGPLLDGFYDGYADDYVATMERLRALPVTVVHGGHEPSFGRDRLVEICDAYLSAQPLSQTTRRGTDASRPWSCSSRTAAPGRRRRRGRSRRSRPAGRSRRSTHHEASSAMPLGSVK